MRPILFSLGSLNFYSYGFFTSLGFIVAGLVIDYLARKKKLITSKHREYFLIDALLFSLIIGLLGARLGYIVLYDFIFRTESLDLTTNLLGGGFVFYIGLAVGLAAFHWWMKKSETPTVPWFDTFMVGVFTGLSFNAFGGYLNDGQIVHIASLVFNVLYAATFFQLITRERRIKNTFLMSLLILFLTNFFLGFWQPETVQWLGLTFSQWVNLLGILGLSVSLVRKPRS